MFRFSHLKRRHFIAAALSAPLAGFAQTAPGKAPATILVLGDSISAEYGLPRGQGWVALLEKKLAAEKVAARVVNASISGDTTAGGRARLAPLLARHKPTHLIIELGANDALRGLPLDTTEANLRAMTQAGTKAGAQVLLLGMQVPPNFGAAHLKRFAAIFPTVAKEEKAAVVPFLLKNVADTADPLRYFQPDRIHPNPAAQPLMLDNVWPVLRKML